jgi:NAD(P)H-quinone oxidoreductase subunit 5
MDLINWWPLMAPAALLVISLAPAKCANANPRVITLVSLWAGFLAFLIAIMIDAILLVDGKFSTPELGMAGLGVSLYFDSLSAAMFTLVSFIGAVVLNYSRNYLHGDDRQGSFFKRLCFTISAVLILICAGNLAFLIIAWIATSIGLNSLLLFYPERPGAQLAAKKKFIASRMGDLLLILSAVLLWKQFGTLSLPELFSDAKNLAASNNERALILPSLLLVLSALLKSAQLPFHGWLVEVMETPTPVSALLHAGIINAGGFLILRLADLIAPSETALHILSLIGGLTALFGSIVMLTQTSVKIALAYSTIAQMGFMMLECGLGAFAAAFLHIIAHSLYKAHAFLSSGSVIDLARASWAPSPGGQPHPARFTLALISTIAIAFAVARIFHADINENPGAITLATILLMSLAHLIANALDEKTNLFVLAKALGMSMGVATAFFALHALVELMFAEILPISVKLHDTEDLIIVILVITSFGSITLFQSVMALHAKSDFWQATYVHISQGLYLNTLANRVMLRFWPRRSINSSH